MGTANLSGENVIMNFTNEYNGLGLGAQLGIQFLIQKKIVIDLFFLGPEINAARNDFIADEASNTIPWSQDKANEAEQDIRNFIHQFPFIRNRTSIMVDPGKKIVTANFKGALPGFRIGASFGIAF